MEFFVKGKRTLPSRAIVDVCVSLSPRNVRDLSDNCLQVALGVVGKVKGHGIKLMAEISRVRKQIDVGDVRFPKGPRDSFAHLFGNRSMFIEAKITLVPTCQIFLV